MVYALEGSKATSIRLNRYISRLVHVGATTSTIDENDSPIDPRSELDSHANMIVLGKHAFVFDNIADRTCEVQPFDPSIGSAKHVPIVDAAIAYECPYSHKVVILLMRNANLIPPFIMCEAGLIVNDTPKIHCDSPTVEDHSIYFPDANFCIPLQLNGIFSYFHTRNLSNDKVMNCDKLFITPDSTNWDPYSSHFGANEESMLD